MTGEPPVTDIWQPYYWGEGIGGGFDIDRTRKGVQGSGWGMIPEGIFFHYSPDQWEYTHGQPAVGEFAYPMYDTSLQYEVENLKAVTGSNKGRFYTHQQDTKYGPDWSYNRQLENSNRRKSYRPSVGHTAFSRGGGGGNMGRLVMYDPAKSKRDYRHSGQTGIGMFRWSGKDTFYDYKGRQIEEQKGHEMAEYSPRELAPGEYAPLYETPGGNLGYQTFEMGMSPSQYAPQGISYTLPVPQAPELQTGPGVEQRTQEIAEEWLRKRNRWSVPDATEGQYRERSGWSPMSSEEIRRKIATWDHTTREKYYKDFQKTALQEQAEQQQRYAKYMNELRYSQGLLLKEQAMQNIMGQVVGLGDQERSDIESQFERRRAEELQAAMGRGMGSATVLGSISRGLEAEEAEATGRLEERLRREQAQTQALLVGDITSWIEGRVDEYPSQESMANIMFGYGAGGAGSEQAQAKDTSGAAAAGAALGCLLGGCCFLFRHARHRDGTEDWVIREYRDNMTTMQQMRGYYKMSEFLCPLMDRHAWIRYAVKWLICDPIVAYGKWFYRDHEYYADKKKGLGHRLGWLFAPVKSFWLKTWKHLGDEFEYIRWNGEIV